MSKQECGIPTQKTPYDSLTVTHAADQGTQITVRVSPPAQDTRFPCLARTVLEGATMRRPLITQPLTEDCLRCFRTVIVDFGKPK